MTDQNRFEIARKLQGKLLHGVDRIQENPTCPKESLKDLDIFGFEIPLVTGQVIDCYINNLSLSILELLYHQYSRLTQV